MPERICSQLNLVKIIDRAKQNEAVWATVEELFHRLDANDKLSEIGAGLSLLIQQNFTGAVNYLQQALWRIQQGGCEKLLHYAYGLDDWNRYLSLEFDSNPAPGSQFLSDWINFYASQGVSPFQIPELKIYPKDFVAIAYYEGGASEICDGLRTVSQEEMQSLCGPFGNYYQHGHSTYTLKQNAQSTAFLIPDVNQGKLIPIDEIKLVEVNS